MKIAFFITNHYQLITFVNMKLYIYPNDDVDLFTTLKEVKRKEEIFIKMSVNRVFYLDDHNSNIFFTQQDTFQKVSCMLGFDRCFEDLYNIAIGETVYDLILTAGYPLVAFCLYVWCRRRNSKSEIWRVGDGTIFHFYPLNYLLYREFMPLFLTFDECDCLWDEVDFMKGFDGEYLYKTEMATPRENRILEIPAINKSGLVRDIMNDFMEISANHYKELNKILFFDTGGVKNGEKKYKNEREILKFVLMYIDKSNISVRCHPTTKIDFYDEFDVLVDKSTYSIEYNYLNECVDGKLFLCIDTTAVHTPYELFDEHPKKVIFFHDLGEDNEKYPALSLFDCIARQIALNLILYYTHKFPQIYIMLSDFENAEVLLKEII